MIEDGLETTINDYLARFLLRYFRNAERVVVRHPDLDAERDLDLLRLHWAISEPVRDLVNHLTRHRHEIQAVLELRRQEDDARVRGRFDARATMIRRLVTGHPTFTVSHEPVRTLESGPNHVLAWVLETAWRLALQFEDMLPEDASYRAAIERSTPGLEEIRRFDAIHEAAKKMNLARRPGPHAVKEASRSRRQIYVFACHAYRALQLIEAGEMDAIIKLLNDTLFGPLYVWQRYELVVGLAVARALSVALARPVTLGFLGGGREPVARVGSYGVHWQSRTEAYEQPCPEPSEAITAKLLDQYGLSVGADRPDLVVLDGDNRAVSIIEVKYSANEESDGVDALRSAIGQLVRYTRGYRPMEQTEDLLDHSIVAVIQHKEGQVPEPKPYGLPLMVDFEGIMQRRLEPWARRLVAAREKEGMPGAGWEKGGEPMPAASRHDGLGQ